MKRTAENDEFLAKRKARQKRIRKRRLIIGLIFFLILGIVTFVGLSLTVFFPISVINTNGSAKYTRDEIIAASGIKVGGNLFTSTVSEDTLRERLPFVESLKIERELPGTVTIKIKDAKEHSCYFTDGKYYTASLKGYALSEYTEKPAGLPEIRAEGINCTLGKRVEFSNDKAGDIISEINRCADEYGVTLNTVDVTDVVSLSVVAEGRFSVSFGTANYLEKKFAHLAGMIKNIEPQKTGKINLSMWTSENTEGTFVAGPFE